MLTLLKRAKKILILILELRTVTTRGTLHRENSKNEIDESTNYNSKKVHLCRARRRLATTYLAGTRRRGFVRGLVRGLGRARARVKQGASVIGRRSSVVVAFATLCRYHPRTDAVCVRIRARVPIESESESESNDDDDDDDGGGGGKDERRVDSGYADDDDGRGQGGNGGWRGFGGERRNRDEW